MSADDGRISRHQMAQLVFDDLWLTSYSQRVTVTNPNFNPGPLLTLFSSKGKPYSTLEEDDEDIVDASQWRPPSYQKSASPREKGSGDHVKPMRPKSPGMYKGSAYIVHVRTIALLYYKTTQGTRKVGFLWQSANGYNNLIIEVVWLSMRHYK